MTYLTLQLHLQTLLQDHAAMSQQEAQETIDKLKVTLPVGLMSHLSTSAFNFTSPYPPVPRFFPSSVLVCKRTEAFDFQLDFKFLSK